MLSSRTYGTVGLLIFSGEGHCVAYDLSTLWPEIVCGETDVCFVTTPATTYLQRQISARGARCIDRRTIRLHWLNESEEWIVHGRLLCNYPWIQ